MMMKVLIACEHSGTVREAFRALGHDAWSCDLEPATDDSEFHLQGDALEVARGEDWDLMIAHPPCTYLSVSGSRWFYHPDDSHLPVEQRRPHPDFPDRRARQEAAAQFFKDLSELPIPRIAIENPVCVMSTRWRKPDQIIQPFEHGDPFKKTTCLWLKGLPELKPTDIVEPQIKEYADGSRFSADYFSWGAKGRSGSSGEGRAITYPGIAMAMAEQWGSEEPVESEHRRYNRDKRFGKRPIVGIVPTERDRHWLSSVLSKDERAKQMGGSPGTGWGGRQLENHNHVRGFKGMGYAADSLRGARTDVAGDPQDFAGIGLYRRTNSPYIPTSVKAIRKFDGKDFTLLGVSWGSQLERTGKQTITIPMIRRNPEGPTRTLSPGDKGYAQLAESGSKAKVQILASDVREQEWNARIVKWTGGRFGPRYGVYVRKRDNIPKSKQAPNLRLLARRVFDTSHLKGAPHEQDYIKVELEGRGVLGYGKPARWDKENRQGTAIREGDPPLVIPVFNRRMVAE